MNTQLVEALHTALSVEIEREAWSSGDPTELHPDCDATPLGEQLVLFRLPS